jgi:DNA invertase Pin-like site-specific DNA recombinase
VTSEAVEKESPLAGKQSDRRKLSLGSSARRTAASGHRLGWAKEQVIVIDEDLGLSGSGSVKRSGFARMTAEVALGHVGIVLGLEVSRMARNNADWYRLLDLCGMTDTLIGDSDGIYHPAPFNNRLAEAEWYSGRD